MQDLFAKLAGAIETYSIGALAIFVGGIVWLTEIHLTTASSAESIQKAQVEITALRYQIVNDKAELQSKIFEKLQDIDKRLSRIEGQIQK